MSGEHRIGLDEYAQRELGPLFDLLYETGCRFVFRAPSVPLKPHSNPVMVQGWACGKLSLLLTIRMNSGDWQAHVPIANSFNEADSLKALRGLIENAKSGEALLLSREGGA